MKEIKLNRKHKSNPNYQKYVALVDDGDYEWLNQWNWTVLKSGHTHYAQRIKNNKAIKMHRLIMDAKPGEIIDHRNRNGLDCQRHNMRFCTKSENGANRKSHVNSTSKYLGVSWEKRSNKWEAKIYKNQKGIYLGRFNTEIEAALVRDKKAKEVYGEFARLNF